MPDATAVTDYFTQKAGRAPTPQELQTYVNGPENFQQQIDYNVAAPNGYARFLAGDQIDLTPHTAAASAAAPAPTAPLAPGQIPGYGIAPNPYASAVQAPTYQQPTTLSPTQYAAPTTEQALNAPGVRVGANLAREGMEASAAAKGSVLSGGFQKELAKYLQDYGTTKYGDVLNQGLSTFGANLSGNQQQLGAADQTFRNQYQTFQGQNQANLSDYLTNYGTSHQAANDYYNALETQANRGAATGAASVTA